MGAQADAFEADVTAHVELAAKFFALELMANLIGTTPVRTGWARANWIASLGSPRDDATGKPAPGQTASSSEQQASQAQVLGYTLADGLLWVANNVPYISLLNYGWSHQQPAGFFERAIDVALAATIAKLGVDFGQNDFRQQVGAQMADNVASAYSPFGED